MQSPYVKRLVEIRHNEFLTEAARLHIVDQLCAHRAAPTIVGVRGWQRWSVALADVAARLHVHLQRLLTTTSGKGSSAVPRIGADSLSIKV
jgi:hypothetical protein